MDGLWLAPWHHVNGLHFALRYVSSDIIRLADLVCGGLECWDVYQRFVGTSLMNLDKKGLLFRRKLISWWVIYRNCRERAIVMKTYWTCGVWNIMLCRIPRVSWCRQSSQDQSTNETAQPNWCNFRYVLPCCSGRSTTNESPITHQSFVHPLTLQSVKVAPIDKNWGLNPSCSSSYIMNANRTCNRLEPQRVLGWCMNLAYELPNGFMFGKKPGDMSIIMFPLASRIVSVDARICKARKNGVLV